MDERAAPALSMARVLFDVLHRPLRKIAAVPKQPWFVRLEERVERVPDPAAALDQDRVWQFPPLLLLAAAAAAAAAAIANINTAAIADAGDGGPNLGELTVEPVPVLEEVDRVVLVENIPVPG
eukprot:SAG22_NODE_5441_length_1013_cov_1.566740_3_plen_122_part_01